MAQPIYDDTDFVALAVHVFDITITIFDAGVFTAHLDGGPYTGSGATIPLARDALLSDIQGGTHVGWTAATESTDSIRITADGPGQHIGGGVGNFNPAVVAPGSGAISIVDVTPFAGIDFESLVQEIEADVAILTDLVTRPADKVVWVDLVSSPRTIQMNFVVDPLPGGEKTALDALVAAYTNVDTASLFVQFTRVATVDVGFTHVAANLVVASKGTPDFGLKLISIYPESFISVSLSESQTNDSGFQTKVTTDFDVMGGVYRVEVSALMGVGMNNNQHEAKFTVDGTVISTPFINPSSSLTKESWYAFSDETLAAGNRTFIVEFRTPDSSTAKISEVRMSATRIGD